MLNIRFIPTRIISSLLHPSVLRSSLPRGFQASQMSSTIFEGALDNHGTLIVESVKEPEPDSKQFGKKLKESLKVWEKDGRRGLMFRVGVTSAGWLPILHENGFYIHHAKGEIITMAKWLEKRVENRIPPYAHTMLGAGAVVVNDNDEILTVCEQYRGTTYWKLPGGYVEPDEDIVEAARREVKEETNIDTEFKSMVAVRHTKKAAFSCSDLYFIIELKPTSNEIKFTEVLDAKWMPLEHYLTHEFVHENNKYFIKKYLEGRKSPYRIGRSRRFHPITNMPQVLYSPTCDPADKDDLDNKWQNS